MAEIKGYKEKSCLVFERDNVKLRFDFKDNSFTKIKDSRERVITSAQSFFTGVTYAQVASLFVDPAYSEFIRMIQSEENRCTNVATLLERIEKHAHLENYHVLGIRYVRYSKPSKYTSIYPKEVINFMRESQIEFSNKWESAFITKRNRQEDAPYKYQALIVNLCTHVRANYYMDLEVYRMLYSLVTGGTYLEKFLELTTPVDEPYSEYDRWGGQRPNATMGYGCEYKTLFDYLVKKWRFEGTDFLQSLTLTRDYRKMQRDLRKDTCDKYPKYLKVIHDIVARNHSFYKQVFEEADFKKCVDYNLEYGWGKYKMVAPQETKDVKEEGTNLNHCVGSYVSKILDGTSQILFMRTAENPEESLVTVEVRFGKINQARGYNNRSLDEAERRWLGTYAKSKDLLY